MNIRRYKFFVESCDFTQANLEKVKEIEDAAYPEFMKGLQDIESIDDVLDYAECDGEIICHIENDWYILGCNSGSYIEIADFASRKSLSFGDILKVLNLLKSFGEKLIKVDARESTSYKLIKLLEKRGKIKILRDKPWMWGSEKMHDMEFKLIDSQSFKEFFKLAEAVDQKDLIIIRDYIKKFAPSIDQNELDLELKKFIDDPNKINKAEIIKSLQSKFNITSMKPKEEKAENAFFDTYQNKLNTNKITKEEFQTLLYFKNEKKNILESMMNDLRNLLNQNKIKLEFTDKPIIYVNELDRNNKIINVKKDFNNLTDFNNILHSLEKVESEIADPIALSLSHMPNLVAKGNNVWVFKGTSPELCRILGKGSNWCISSKKSASFYFQYRIEHKQTQYFVFDFNWPEGDDRRYVNPGVAPEGEYSEWVDFSNGKITNFVQDEDGTSQIAIKGFNNIQEYKDYLETKGISQSIWIAEPIEDWELELQEIINKKDFFKAKNHPKQPDMFENYLKIIDQMNDDEFNYLNDSQKKMFLFGKSANNLTKNQALYIKDNFKKDYLNSLDDILSKIYYFVKVDDFENFFKSFFSEKFSDPIFFKAKILNEFLKNTAEKEKFIQKLISTSKNYIGSLLLDLDYDNINDLPLFKKYKLDKIFKKLSPSQKSKFIHGFKFIDGFDKIGNKPFEKVKTLLDFVGKDLDADSISSLIKLTNDFNIFKEFSKNDLLKISSDDWLKIFTEPYSSFNLNYMQKIKNLDLDYIAEIFDFVFEPSSNKFLVNILLNNIRYIKNTKIFKDVLKNKILKFAEKEIYEFVYLFNNCHLDCYEIFKFLGKEFFNTLDDNKLTWIILDKLKFNKKTFAKAIEQYKDNKSEALIDFLKEYK